MGRVLTFDNLRCQGKICVKRGRIGLLFDTSLPLGLYAMTATFSIVGVNLVTAGIVDGSSKHDTGQYKRLKGAT